LIGLSLKDASKFAFLLAIPTILGALTLLIFDLNNGNVSFDLFNISIGFFTSMIFAFFTIKLFLKLVEKIGMIPFVAYRFLLGILLLII
jgi:undecaprenyl-diphosphatase